VTDGTPISVTLGATTSGIDFDLLTGGTIQGTVTEEGSAAPLDSGWVRIFDAGGAYLTSGYPNSSGDYETSLGLATGTYYAATSSFEGYFEELYSEISCAESCTITDGTPITVTLGSTMTGVDFTLGGSIFIGDFESGDLSAWSRTVP